MAAGEQVVRFADANGTASRVASRVVCLEPVVAGAEIRLGYRAESSDGVLGTFEEVVELPASLDDVPRATLDPVLRLLSATAALSYFKAFAPTRLAVPGGLTAAERHYAEAVARHGLGEFAYVNDLPEVLDTVVEAPELPAPSEATTTREAATPERLLVAVGGGKDSIVSIEALRGTGRELTLFSVNSYAPITATAEVAGLPLVSVRRRLDPALRELNAAGAPNGHVPVTAVNSLLAVLTALALGHDTVVFSNEASSSRGNVLWHGHEINHQWSKGSDFEGLLRTTLPPGAPDYVSLLRPLTELRIARRFADHTAYHPVFTSCNAAFKLREADRSAWCGHCPKCRFVFLILSPFIGRAALLAIFSGRDLFADEAQRGGFVELLGGVDAHKPFECVGEPDECREALGLLARHDDWRDHPFLADPAIRAALDQPQTLDQTEDDASAFAFRESGHHLPPALEAVARAV